MVSHEKAGRLTVEIPTDTLVDADHAGKYLARVLRAVADRVDEQIAIVPAGEWQDERYWKSVNLRVIDPDGGIRQIVLVARYSLTKEGR